MFSVTRFSAGARSPVWAVNERIDTNRANRLSATFFISGLLTEARGRIEKTALSPVEKVGEHSSFAAEAAWSTVRAAPASVACGKAAGSLYLAGVIFRLAK
jgi:hypothetical protein